MLPLSVAPWSLQKLRKDEKGCGVRAAEGGEEMGTPHPETRLRTVICESHVTQPCVQVMKTQRDTRFLKKTCILDVAIRGR